MEVCFDKDTLGHYFPTELVKLFEEASRKNDKSPKKNVKCWKCCFRTRLSTHPDQTLGLSGYKWPKNHSLLFRSQLPLLISRVNASICDAGRARSCCCPTLFFHVAFPINSLLYVCTFPLLSIPLVLRVALLWYGDFIFVIAGICLFLYAGCLCKVLTLVCFGMVWVGFFLLCLGSFWIVIDVLCSLLIRLVSVFQQFYCAPYGSVFP